MSNGVNQYPLDEESYAPQPGEPEPADAGPPYYDFEQPVVPFRALVSVDEPKQLPYDKVRDEQPLETKYLTLEYIQCDTTKLPVYETYELAIADMLPQNVGRLFRLKGSMQLHIMLPLTVIQAESIV